jgi:hypothetical protein
MNLHTLCRRFAWIATADGGRLITPWRYDDGDQVVVFVTPHGEDWRADDNGEGLFRLAGAGIDPASERVQARLQALTQILGVHLDDDGEQIYAVASTPNLESAALAVAEASAQLQGLTCLRPQARQPSDFRERIIDLVETAARAAGVESRRDVPADASQSFLADVYLCTPIPLLVIAATSAQRLMEAEIIWLDAARRLAPVYVLATVESARDIGVAQYTRANYYTDKTVEYTGPEALSTLLAARLQH